MPFWGRVIGGFTPGCVPVMIPLLPGFACPVAADRPGILVAAPSAITAVSPVAPTAA